MSLITSELNYARKSHRVDIPLYVEIDGESYRAQDWSVSGIGLKVEKEHQFAVGDTIKARCVLPMQDAIVAIQVKLLCKNIQGGIVGFEFLDLGAKNKRVLRHYIEMAVDGRIDNVEDLVGIITAPNVNSPIDEALSLTDLEAGSLTKQFRTRSYLSIGVGVVFFLAVLWAMFYTTSYRIEGVGVVAGNVLRVTAPADGKIANVYVDEEKPVKKGDQLFLLSNPDLDAEIRRIQVVLNELEKAQSQYAKQDDPNSPRVNSLSLLKALESQYLSKRAAYQEAEALYAERLINRKELSAIERQMRSAFVAYVHERDRYAGRDSLQRAILQNSLNGEEGITQHDIDLMKVELNRLQRKRGQQLVTAPVNGRLHNISYNEDLFVKAGDVVALVEEDKLPYVILRLKNEEAIKISVGMPAELNIPILNSNFEGRVTDIGYSAIKADASLTQEGSLNDTLIKVVFNDQGVRLPPQARVQVWIRTFSLFD